MQPEATPDRRTVVAALSVIACGGGLAACSAGDSTSSTAPSSSASGPAASASGPAASASGSAPAQGELVALSQVPVGGAVAVQAPTGAVVVAQPSAGEVVAFSAVCTHQGSKVAPQGNRLVCPLHGSIFDAFTGKVLKGPATAPLSPVAVKVSGQDVVAG